MLYTPILLALASCLVSFRGESWSVMVCLPSHATAPKSSLTNSLSWAQVLTQLGAPHAAVQIAEPTPQGAHWSKMVKDGQRWSKMVTEA